MENLFYRLQVSGMLRRGPTARAGKAIRSGGHDIRAKAKETVPTTP